MPVSMTSAIASVAIATTAATQTVPVTSVEPIITNQPVMVQVQHCTGITQQQAASNQNVNIIGGIIGGVIGSQIGNTENTKRIMTGIGAIVGSRLGNNGYSDPQQLLQTTHCAPTIQQHAVPTITGYNVSYIIDGIQQSTVLSYNPGSHITIQRSYTIR